VKVRRGVLVGRVVAAADLAAGLTHPQMNPRASDLEAFFASELALGQIGALDLIQVGAIGHFLTLHED
jgi:hypothetical protein